MRVYIKCYMRRAVWRSARFISACLFVFFYSVYLKIHSMARVERILSEFGAVVCHIVSVVVCQPNDRHTFEFFSSSVLSRYQTFNRFHCMFVRCAYFVRVNDVLCCGPFHCVKIRSNFDQISRCKR